MIPWILWLIVPDAVNMKRPCEDNGRPLFFMFTQKD
jgi:hypothetical protein